MSAQSKQLGMLFLKISNWIGVAFYALILIAAIYNQNSNDNGIGWVIMFAAIIIFPLSTVTALIALGIHGKNQATYATVWKDPAAYVVLAILLLAVWLVAGILMRPGY